LNRENKYIFIIRFVIVWAIILSVPVMTWAMPQVNYPPDTTNTQDTSHVNLIYPFNDNTGNPYLDNQNTSPLFMRDPENIKREIIYNPETNTYEFVNKIGDFEYRPPTIMDFEDYKDYDLKNDVRSYWNDRKQTAGTSDGTRLIPKIYIGGEAFDRIFGSNTIDIRPQGSAEVSFGILSNNREDPALDVRQRRTTNFDFDMRIQMNVIAKIGDKIEFKANYNTESSFDFENTLKLKYEGKEDEIIKIIEAGNVSLPLRSSLIQGSQSLFGIKTELQFGKTNVTAIFSEQQSETQNITVEGGAQTSKFQLSALDYEENRHFFLAQHFRDKYEQAVSTLPIITSDVTITKIEVWVTNLGAATEENRNIVAFTDLGEGNPEKIHNPYINPLMNGDVLPSNWSNDMLYKMDTAQIRDINTVTSYLTGDPFGIGLNNYFIPGEDFVKLENARKLRESEYSVNTRLGFISLNTNLNPDQVLAIAVQYTVIGYDSVFQIGEFSDQGNTAPNNLVVKLLKSSNPNTRMPMWDLMMKNVYSIGAYQVERTDFRLNILYSGNKQGVPTGYFTEGPEEVVGVPLIHLLGLDNLDNQMNPVPKGDGMFDFIDGAATNGGTFQASNGRLFFTSLEPFGSYLRDSVFPNNPEYADYYAYDSLYTTTKTGAEQFPEKNRYLIEGMYKSQSGADISLNALNVPQGSVRVSAGGVPLVENVDYTVDYTLGRVKIINEGLLNSGVPINVSLESNSTFNIQQKRMMGVHVDHEFSKDFHVGGTILNLHEKPLTQKVNYGDDPISNTIWGLDLSYRTESRWLTKMIDKLPGISTNETSRISIDGEFAQFIPGHSKAVGKTGTSYIDDFEGAQSTIDLKHIGSWFLASVPQGQPDLFPEGMPVQFNDPLVYGKNRAKFAWYIIDPLFYDRSGGLRPSNVDKNEISRNSVRQVLETEVFPNKDIPNGTPTNIAVLNFAYYPEERGQYNYDVDPVPNPPTAGLNSDGTLAEPQTRWGGIMRKIESSDFEAANIEYIEFWMMDPFTEDPDNPGEMYINLGEISEDILRDGRKSYENGLPVSAEVTNVDTTNWGRVPTMQALVESFSSTAGSRPFQDVGYDGLGDDDETSFFENSYLNVIRERYGANSEAYLKASQDPSADNYHYFRGSDWDQEAQYSSVTERYKQYNGTEGNSPTDDINPENYPTAQTNIPNVEDINRDNTLSEAERYFQYKIELDPNKMEIGKNHIADIRYAKNVRLANGDVTDVKWYQFKIPVQKPDKIVGNISDFRSIRFMRVFMRGFRKPIVTRFATFELVRSEWRRYQNSLLADGEYVPGDDGSVTNLVMSTVNIEENGQRQPVPYVIPPGIEREVNFGTTNYVFMNEQSIQLEVNNLLDGDARGIFKTTQFDFRQFKKLEMYVHAEKRYEEEDLDYGDMTVFVRIGSDFNHNYYEYEIPVKFTKWYISPDQADSIWPEANNLDINLEHLVQVKENRNVAMRDPNSELALYKPYTEYDGRAKITVMGSPTISDVKGILIGVRNPKRMGSGLDDDGNPINAIVWVDELRLTDFNDRPGWAATGRFETVLADFARVSFQTSHSSAGFSSLEKKITQIPLEYVTDYIVTTDLDWGKFFSEKAGVNIPMHFDYGVSTVTPEYNPLQPDVILKEDLKTYENKQKKDSVKRLVIDHTSRTNVNLMNVRKTRTNNKKKPRIYDVENFDVSFAYSNVKHRNIDFEYDDQKEFRGGLGYSYNGRPKNFVPLKKVNGLNSKHLALIKDFNIYLLPKTIIFRTDMNRQIHQILYRDKSFGDVIIYPTVNRIWNWNRMFEFKYDFSKSLSFEFSTGTNAYIKEPTIYPDKETEEWEEYKKEIWNQIGQFGTRQHYNQKLKVIYNLPLKKIPILDWITAAANLQTLYTWAASPVSIQPRFGNNIENGNQIQVNSNADLQQLYNKIPYFKNMDQSQQRSRTSSRTRGGQRPQTPANDTVKQNKQVGKKIGEGFLKILMMVKKVSVTWSRGQGTSLPGYMLEPKFLGMDFSQTAPGWGFIFGQQYEDFPYRMAEYGWYSADSALNNPYMKKSNEALNYKINGDILGIIRIDIDGDRVYADNYQSFFRYDNEGVFNEYTPMNTGNFSISYSIIKTSFQSADTSEMTPVFTQFLENRNIVAERLARDNPAWQDLPDDQKYYYDTIAGREFPYGYGSNSQPVLYHSFLAAYTGSDAASVGIDSPFPKFPIPNWRITFSGLINIPAFSKVFRSFNITHGYRSMLSVTAWSTNVNYDEANQGETFQGTNNFVTKYDVGVVSVIENYSPLIGLDMTMNNSLNIRAEYKKSRNLSLSFVNNQITEIIGNELVLGLGYRLKGLKFQVASFSGKKSRKTGSDLNLKLDFGIRDNKTTLRRVDEINNQVSAGSMQYTLNFSADYMLSQSLQIRAYYNWTSNNPYVSAQFPNSTTNAGISLRFNLAQ
jgi:cell surface protein SprA